MTHPGGLSQSEAEAWEKLAKTVVPLHPRISHKPTATEGGGTPGSIVKTPPKFVKPTRRLPSSGKSANTPMSSPPSAAARSPRGNLDSHWDRKLKSGDIVPDFSLDLHGHGLDAAYRRLMDGMFRARATGARVVMIVTGKPRPVDAADRGTSRGAIRAKILDWLAASEHGASIAAIRKAHRRHGGDGALYIVFKRGS